LKIYEQINHKIKKLHHKYTKGTELRAEMALVLENKNKLRAAISYIQNINKKATIKDKNSVVFNFPEKNNTNG
jgi:hypothetical protein